MDVSEEEIMAEDSIEFDKIYLFVAVVVPVLCLVRRSVDALSLKVASMYFKPSSKESEVRGQIREIKKEMAVTPQVQEFVKFSKLKRKLNALMLDYEATVEGRQAVLGKFRSYIKTGLQVVMTLLTASLVITNRNTPVFIVPTNWFYPFSSLLSYPTEVPGGVSIISWFIICRTVLQVVTNLQSASVKADSATNNKPLF